MIIRADRSVIAFSGLTDANGNLISYDEFIEIVKSQSTIEDSITQILKWKSQITDEYLAEILGISISEVQTAANNLAAQSPAPVIIA